MGTHIMHLAREPYEAVLEGRKRVEVRLYDEKRKRVRLGDMVIFRPLEGDGEVCVRVTGLLRFRSFKELFEVVSGQVLISGELPVDEKVRRMRKYYTVEEEERHGVLGIAFEVVECGKV